MAPKLGLLVALCLLAGCAHSGPPRGADVIAGRVTGSSDSGVVPLALVQVMVRPLRAALGEEPSDELPPELAESLLGVALTNVSGYFEIANLASVETCQMAVSKTNVCGQVASSQHFGPIGFPGELGRGSDGGSARESNLHRPSGRNPGGSASGIYEWQLSLRERTGTSRRPLRGGVARFYP